MRKISFLIAIFGVTTTYSQTIITDRPDQTESSSTIPKYSLQIESGIGIAVSENSKLTIRQFVAPTTLFRYGITKGIEFRLLSQFESTKNFNTNNVINGFSDLEIGTKIQIIKKENFEFAFLSHLILPTGTKDISRNSFGTINKLSFSHPITQNSSIGYNVGYNYFGQEMGSLTYSVALGVSVSKKVGFYLEPFGDIVNFKNHFANFDAGITYLIKDNFQLDFSFGVGINYSMNYLSTGFSWNVSK